MVAGDHDWISQESTIGDFSAPHSSRFFSYSYSIRTNIAIWPIGPQVTAKSLDQRSVSPKFKQPSNLGGICMKIFAVPWFKLEFSPIPLGALFLNPRDLSHCGQR
ncbi:MAG: hypothetical protein DWH99_10525 [Planctomycetota bacterium]|nr:MAG: hypothetical protein DWH99_10525 [Planctomycetota bacterium]